MTGWNAHNGKVSASFTRSMIRRLISLNHDSEDMLVRKNFRTHRFCDVASSGESQLSQAGVDGDAESAGVVEASNPISGFSTRLQFRGRQFNDEETHWDEAESPFEHASHVCNDQRFGRTGLRQSRRSKGEDCREESLRRSPQTDAKYPSRRSVGGGERVDEVWFEI
jgi:hypothetical protein